MILPFQRQTKLKVVTDFSTVSKGVSVGGKPRAALKQVLFSQSEKNPPSEVLLGPGNPTDMLTVSQCQTGSMNS